MSEKTTLKTSEDYPQKQLKKTTLKMSEYEN